MMKCVTLLSLLAALCPVFGQSPMPSAVLIEVAIRVQGSNAVYVVNGHPFSLGEVDAVLTKLAKLKLEGGAPITLQCEDTTTARAILQVADLCKKNRLECIRVIVRRQDGTQTEFSMREMTNSVPVELREYEFKAP